VQLRRYKQILVEVGVFQRQVDHVKCKFQVEGNIIHQPLFVSKTSVYPFMWCQNFSCMFFPFVTKHVCDRQTDWRTERQTELRSPRPHYHGHTRQVAQLWQRDRTKLDTFSINVQRYWQNHAQNWIFGPPYGGIRGNICALWLSESFNTKKPCNRVSSRECQFYS